MSNHLSYARTIARLLDNQFEFLGFRFGLDPIIGVIPVFGDILSLGLSVYIIWIGFQMKVSAPDLAKMWRNVIFDFVIGTIPFIGDISDFFFKANMKNLALLEKYEKSHTVVEGEIV